MKLKLGDLLKGDIKLKLIIGVGILLILLIAFSGIFTGKDKQPEAVDARPSKELSDYKSMLQSEIKVLLEQIDGVGKAEVMVTLKGDSEYVYAKQEKQNLDKVGGIGDTQGESVKDTYENSTILVEDENGRKQALVKTKLEPKVNGVLIVCDGANDPIVEQKVTQAVKTVLGIGANNVCVVS